ncbi:MAG: hypothetical protein QOH93_1055 [Chloroflexia bacterium]|nr:hypothetical protein [Chloroflexia bacterium]
MAQGGQAGGGQVNVTTPPPRRNNTAAIVAAAVAGLLLLGLVLWLLFRPKDVNVNVTGPTATPTTQVVEVVVTPTPEPPTNTPLVVQVEVTATPEPPSPTPVVQTVVVEVTNTPGPVEPTATTQVVVVTATANPTNPTPPPPTQPPTPSAPPATPTTVPTLTSEESQIAGPLRQGPNGNQVVYVHYDGSNIQVYFNILPGKTLPDAALQAKQQVKDLLQQLVQVELTYGQVTLYGSYPLPAAGQGTPATAQQGTGTVVVEATYTHDTVKNTDWGNSPPEPVYDKAQSTTINPEFQKAGTP